MKSIRTHCHSNCQSWQCKWAHCIYCGAFELRICSICIWMHRVKIIKCIQWMSVFSAHLSFYCIWFCFRKYSLFFWLLMIIYHGSTQDVTHSLWFWLILIFHRNAKVKLSNEIAYPLDWSVNWKFEILWFTCIEFCLMQNRQKCYPYRMSLCSIIALSESSEFIWASDEIFRALNEFFALVDTLYSHFAIRDDPNLVFKGRWKGISLFGCYLTLS